MSLPRPLIHQPQHTLNLAYDCPDRVDQLSLIARFDLTDVNIGLAETGHLSAGLSVYPSVTRDIVQVLAPASFDGHSVVTIFDAIGRVIDQRPYAKAVPISVEDMAGGTYSVQVANRLTGGILNGRFVRE